MAVSVAGAAVKVSVAGWVALAAGRVLVEGGSVCGAGCVGDAGLAANGVLQEVASKSISTNRQTFRFNMVTSLI
jgi:hypothetical protein